MSITSFDNFKNKKNIIEENKEKYNGDIDEELKSRFTESKTNCDVINSVITDINNFYNINFDFNVENSRINKLLDEIHSSYDENRVKLLIEDCRVATLDAIIKPFGLGDILFNNRRGGNVDTIHNVRNSIYTTEKNKDNYENRENYDSKKYHGHYKYKSVNKEASVMKKEGILKDSYSDKVFKRNDKTNLDHTISAKEIHDDAGRVLAGLNGEDLANTDSNLNITSEITNKSKNKKSVQGSKYNFNTQQGGENKKEETFIEYLNRTEKERKDKIRELESKGELTEKEANILKKEKELDSIDKQKLIEKDKQARKEYESKVNKTYYTSNEFITNVGKTSALEGMKMGAQQAIGLVIREFALGVFDEIQDIFKNNNDIKINKKFLINLKSRLERISERVKSKWKLALSAFKEGAISGFFSNIITIVLNCFLTTSKRVVRIIREGFFSLVKAFKILMNPDKDITKEEAAHEAVKIIASSLVLTTGILIEDEVGRFIGTIPLIGGFCNIIAPVLVGIVTGLGMAFIVYAVDKLDLFGVNSRKEHDYVIDGLNNLISADLQETEILISDLVLWI